MTRSPLSPTASLIARLQANAAWLRVAAMLGLAALALYALHRMLEGTHIADVRAAFHSLAPYQIATACGLTALSYTLLTFYDVLALRIIGKPLPYRTAALASFTSYTISHVLGFALVTGGSARYRVYHAAGLSTGDVVRVVLLAGIAFWSGTIVTAAVALLLQSQALTLAGLVLSPGAQHAAGAAILALGAGALAYFGRGGRTLSIFRWSFVCPSAKLALAQTLVAALDLAAASAALMILIPGVGWAHFPAFYLGYALAIIVALLTHVPGGLGIFEAVVIATVPGEARATMLAALLAYRIIYYLLPLAAAALLVIARERPALPSRLSGALSLTQSLLNEIAPTLLAALGFAGGAVLLVSGSLPAIPERLHRLSAFLPLPFVEASHIAASLSGLGLLLLAPGLLRRLDGAFWATRALLLAGMAFSLAKGVDYEEAIILGVIALALQISRPAFYRHTALTREAWSPRWIATIAFVLLLSTWIGLFAYRHIAYQNDLWWQFAWNGDASRFLRASFGMALMLAILAGWSLFGAAAPAAGDAAPADPGPALARAARTDALLALTGDKRFLMAPSGQAFLMYQVQGESWIVMGNPVGPAEEWPELLWRLREKADAAQGRLLLYQITLDALPFAVDMGLQIVKYGEEARVDLATFTLEGPERKSLRNSTRRAEREGAAFAVLPAAQLPAHMAELRAVSDAWLAAKQQTEKTFSVGRFEDDYIRRFDCAVVRWQGRIVAFANIWATPGHEELSVDLMRHGDTLPYGAMDYLFVQLMLWGKAQGYGWFTLGIAPLSGLEARRLAPLWSRAGALLFRHGDPFYSFDGLRAYKEKFAPQWEPRYLAGPQGFGLARSLIDLQRLVGGGRRSAATRQRERSDAENAERD